MKPSIAMLVASCLLLACASGARPEQRLVRDNGWAIVGAGGVGVNPAWEAWLALDEADLAVSGSTGCNIMRGAYRVDGAALTIPPLVTTKRGCEPARMDAERRVLSALADTAGWRLQGERLQLLNAQGVVVLEAEARADSAS